MCSTCQSHIRHLWGPNQQKLELRTIHDGYWISLQQCPECDTYWVYSPYEPYASFSYWVKWLGNSDSWETIHSHDNGATIRAWHKMEIRKHWRKLPATDQQAIEAHRRRSYFSHNPIDMKVENEGEIRRTMKRYL